MTTKLGPIACGLLLVMFAARMSSASECLIHIPDVPEEYREADIVFGGTIVKVGGSSDRLDFQVDRVWKGNVGREISIYQIGPPFIGSSVYRPDDKIKYIIFARQLSDEDRKSRPEAEEPTAFGIQRTCGTGHLWSREEASGLDKITRGKKPRR
jgi:hypothetical protein